VYGGGKAAEWKGAIGKPCRDQGSPSGGITEKKGPWPLKRAKTFQKPTENKRALSGRAKKIARKHEAIFG